MYIFGQSLGLGRSLEHSLGYKLIKIRFPELPRQQGRDGRGRVALSSCRAEAAARRAALLTKR